MVLIVFALPPGYCKKPRGISATRDAFSVAETVELTSKNDRQHFPQGKTPPTAPRGLVAQRQTSFPTFGGYYSPVRSEVCPAKSRALAPLTPGLSEGAATSTTSLADMPYSASTTSLNHIVRYGWQRFNRDFHAVNSGKIREKHDLVWKDGHAPADLSLSALPTERGEQARTVDALGKVPESAGS